MKLTFKWFVIEYEEVIWLCKKDEIHRRLLKRWFSQKINNSWGCLKISQVTNRLRIDCTDPFFIILKKRTFSIPLFHNLALK